MSSISVNGDVRGSTGERISAQVGWWLLILVCGLYGGYALFMAGVEISYRLGIAESAPQRAVPAVFIIHALAGGVALISGALQFNRRILQRRRRLHRVLGRSYVGAIWLASAGGLWSALVFDVSLAARIVFALLAVLWFGTTTIALMRILNRDVNQHREWMIRSFSLSLFFVTFSFWVPGLASTALPEAVAYPLAVFLSWALNLVVAELWIRHTRRQAMTIGN